MYLKNRSYTTGLTHLKCNYTSYTSYKFNEPEIFLECLKLGDDPVGQGAVKTPASCFRNWKAVWFLQGGSKQ